MLMVQGVRSVSFEGAHTQRSDPLARLAPSDLRLVSTGLTATSLGIPKTRMSACGLTRTRAPQPQPHRS